MKPAEAIKKRRPSRILAFYVLAAAVILLLTLVVLPETANELSGSEHESRRLLFFACDVSGCRPIEPPLPGEIQKTVALYTPHALYQPDACYGPDKCSGIVLCYGSDACFGSDTWPGPDARYGIGACSEPVGGHVLDELHAQDESYKREKLPTHIKSFNTEAAQSVSGSLHDPYEMFWKELYSKSKKSFICGSADLTGDGLAETVYLEDGRIVVIRSGQEIWRSDSAWQVVDVALGDANDDGRTDIIAALWKPGEDGALTAHPFMIGYRRGYVRVIWGGSPVTFGIEELLLADTNGNGALDLVVLEAAEPEEGPGTALRTLAVWDWHGWNYSLRWRSAPGYYRNPVFFPAANKEGGIIVVEAFR